MEKKLWQAKYPHGTLSLTDYRKIGNDYPLLTQEDVDRLPLETKLIIQWSGGNGPHEYTVQDMVGGKPTVQKFNNNAGWWYGQIDFVGPENYHTKVWLKKYPSRVPDKKPTK